MASAIHKRILRLEIGDRSPRSTLRVIEGYSDEDCDQQVTAMIESGEAQQTDLFVCLRRFSEPPAGRSAPAT